MHLPYFYLLHGILQLWKELTRRGFKNMLKITKKNIQGKIIKTISYFFFIFYFTTFLITHFLTFLQQFTAGNLKVAGESTSHRCIFTTLLSPNNNNNNNLIFILRKIHVNMIKCALHESKLSTLISHPK